MLNGLLLGMKTLKEKIKGILCGVFVILFYCSNAFAMTFEDNGTVFFARNNRGDNTTGVMGDSEVYVLSSTGENLKFVRHFEDYNNAYIKLMSVDGHKDYLSFPVKKYRSSTISIIEVQGINPNIKFWVVRSVHGVSDSACDGIWVIGPYQNQYISYVTLDGLQKAGLEGYEISPKIVNGYFQIQGWVRNRGNDLGRTGKMDSLKSTMLLFWDDEAQWFGMSKN